MSKNNNTIHLLRLYLTTPIRWCLLGALYSDGTKDGDKMDDTVIPGGEHTYTWEITEEFGPTPSDKACIPWAYHSHSKDAGKDTNSGLLGTLLTCKKGKCVR